MSYKMTDCILVDEPTDECEFGTFVLGEDCGQLGEKAIRSPNGECVAHLCAIHSEKVGSWALIAGDGSVADRFIERSDAEEMLAEYDRCGGGPHQVKWVPEPGFG